VLCHKQNSLFCNNEKAFYSSLQQNISKDLPYPDLQELQSFWQGLFEKNSNANLQASWLANLSSTITTHDETITKPLLIIDEVIFFHIV